VAEVLSELKARSPRSGPDEPVFLDSRGRPQTKNNLQHQIKGAIKKANKSLIEAGVEPIPAEVTPYSFRRLYASLRAARWVDQDGTLRPGDDQVYIAEQMGHTDAAMTFRVYQRAVKRRERLTGAHLEAFDKDLEWARLGTNQSLPPVQSSRNAAAEARIER
jgi:integrase